jgi:hypothetical protein
VRSLDDSDADAFFQQGDEGTYTGGPGDSIPAGVVNVFDDLEEEALPRLTKEQIERRDRYTKWVTGLVGALGVSALLAVGIRAVGSGADEMQKATGAAPDPVRPAAPPTAAPVLPVEAEPIHAAAPEPPPPAEPPPAAPPEPAKATKPTKPSDDAPRRAKTATADRTKARVHRESTPVVTPPRTTTSSSMSHSSPPTAYFPD